jgi:hypothetical protein
MVEDSEQEDCQVRNLSVVWGGGGVLLSVVEG